MAIIICHIDFFKFYYDTYGHQKGDDCLIKVAEYVILSIGALSTMTNSDSSFKGQLQRADTARYETKDTERNKTVYKPFLSDEIYKCKTL